jgi:hypothetical protein
VTSRQKPSGQVSLPSPTAQLSRPRLGKPLGTPRSGQVPMPDKTAAPSPRPKHQCTTCRSHHHMPQLRFRFCRWPSCAPRQNLPDAASDKGVALLHASLERALAASFPCPSSQLAEPGGRLVTHAVCAGFKAHSPPLLSPITSSRALRSRPPQFGSDRSSPSSPFSSQHR